MTDDFVGSATISRLCLKPARRAFIGLPLFFLVSFLAAQSTPPTAPPTSPNQPPPAQTPAPQPAETKPGDQTPAAPSSAQQPDNGEGQQTKRIMGIAPNFQAVSANTHLPPMTVKGKFWLATEGTFDYSSFISVGIEAGVEQASRTYPEFHQGAAGYGRYYWHTFSDSGIENYFTGAFLPVLIHQDPRYYTLYHGKFVHRTLYAFSRLWITKRDSGRRDFNYSEIVGSGIAGEISSRYYPAHERQASEVLERWASQVLNDGVGNVFEEFWPDIHQKLFHRH